MSESRNSFNVHILAADHVFYEGPCESLIVPAPLGQMGILANHSNMVTAIVPGRMDYRLPGEHMQYAAVAEGLVKVENGEVLVLVDSIERPEEIDVNRAKRKAEEAEEAAKDDPEGGFDVVFIDAAKSHYKAFWDLAMPLCNDEAMIICDNVLMKGMTASDEYDPGKKYKTSIRKMREFIQYITDLPYADTCILPVGDGVSISVIDKEKNS